MVSTGKVGDTINAKYAPENATNPKFAWFVGDSATQVETPILDATTASFTVTEAYVGKFIKVTVTGDGNSAASATTTAAVQAAATDKIAIVSATQTGSATIEVKVNKPITGGTFDIALNRGTVAQTIATVIDEAGTTITITNGVALSVGEYTVKVTSKTDATETAEAKVTCEKSELKEIKFLGEELVLTSSALKEAKTTLKGYDQFENEVALTGSISVTSTKGLATYTAKDSKVTVDSTYGGTATSVVFTPGEKITLTAIYTSGTTVLQIVKELTVSAVATLNSFEVGELTTTDKSLVGKKVILKNFAKNTYYLPVKVAKDQYGNDLTTDELNDMMKVTAGGNLYINPTATTKAGATAYVDKFEKLSDGTIAMKLAKGDLSIPGTATVTLTGIGGYSGKVEFDIFDNPHVSNLTISAPNLYSGVPATLDVSAVDQDGEALDLYDYVADGTYTNTTPLTMSDTNNLIRMSTTVTPTFVGSTLKVKRNTAKKTVEFTYTPKSGESIKHNEILSVITAEGTPDTVTWSVDTKPTPYGIGDLTSKVKTAFASDETSPDTVTVLSETTVQILDSTGAVIDYYNNPGSIAAVAFIPAASSYTGTLTAGNYYAVVTGVSGKMSATATLGTPTPATVDITSGGAPGSYTVKIDLCKAKDTDTFETPLATKEFKFTVLNAMDPKMKYSATLATGSELLYVNKNSTDEAAFTVTKTDSTGISKDMDETEYDVTVDSGLKVTSDKTVSGKVDGISAKGTAVARIWVSQEVVATVDVPYDVAAPAPQKPQTYDLTNDTVKVSTDLEDQFKVLSLANGVVTLTSNSTSASTPDYALCILDQYGIPMAGTSWALDGKALASASNGLKVVDGTAVKIHTLTATNGQVSGDWSINQIVADGDIEVSGSDVTVTTAEAFVKAVKDAADKTSESTKIIVSASVTTTEDFALAAGDSIYVPKNVIWTIGNSSTVTNNGKVYGKGTVVVDTGATITGASPSGSQTSPGIWALEDNTLILKSGAQVTGTQDLAGHIELEGNVDFSGATQVRFVAFTNDGETTPITNTLTLEAGAVVEGLSKVEVESGETLTVEVKQGDGTKEIADVTGDGTKKLDDQTGIIPEGISTDKEFLKAIANPDVKEIVLTGNIKINSLDAKVSDTGSSADPTSPNVIERTRDITIDLGSYTLDLDNNKLKFNRADNTADREFVIKGSSVTEDGSTYVGTIKSSAYYAILVQGNTEEDGSVASLSTDQDVEIITTNTNGCAILVYQGAKEGQNCKVDLSGVKANLVGKYAVGLELGKKTTFTHNTSGLSTSGWDLRYNTGGRKLNYYGTEQKDVDQVGDNDWTEAVNDAFEAWTAAWVNPVAAGSGN